MATVGRMPMPAAARNEEFTFFAFVNQYKINRHQSRHREDEVGHQRHVGSQKQHETAKMHVVIDGGVEQEVELLNQEHEDQGRDK